MAIAILVFKTGFYSALLVLMTAESRGRLAEARGISSWLSVHCTSTCFNQTADNDGCVEDCAKEFEDFLKLHINNGGIDKSAVAGSGPTRPGLLCRGETKLVLKWTQEPIPGTPVVFLLELWSPEEKRWNYLNMTDQTFTIISSLRSGRTYEFRLRSLTADGQIGAASQSGEISTLEDGFIPAVIENATIEQEYRDGVLKARISWEPAPDRTCYYDVDLMETFPQEGQPFSYRSEYTHEPKSLFHVEYDQLIYDTNYTVIVRGRTGNRNRNVEGEEYNATFVTLSCLEANNFNTSICRPRAPKDLSAYGTQLIDSLFNVTVKWTAPATEPSFYNIQLKVFDYVNTSLTNPSFLIYSMNVSGNATESEFPSVNLSSSYEVEVKGYSPAGYGEKASVYKTLANTTTTKTFTLTTLSIADSFSNAVFVIVITILLVSVTLGTLLLLCHHHRKRQRYDQRCQYFESLDKKLPITVNLYGPKADESYVADDWEVSVDRLLLGEVLGEGAFGVVRQGLLQPSQQDQNLVEVAVKMLRDDPSLDEIRQFHREIEMMKTVGQHAHIVSILGCCTHTDMDLSICVRLMLITEYCALGDLQSFLRKEWDKMSKRNSKLVLREVSRLTETTQPINYAQLLLSTDGSARHSVPLTSNASIVVNQLYDIQTGGRSGEERDGSDERLLTSNDLISFARQVTMGMEYLAQNRVVHRDLAARNVLVCSNSMIKISDFGLSRDVYEQNVYRKQGMGKLPIKWMAIESLSHQIYTTQSDVWSFGVLLWEIVTLGGNPYPSTQTNSVFKLLRSGYRMECPVNCSAELYEIMTDCWEDRPKDRPTFAQLHRTFDELLERYMHGQYLNLNLIVSN